MTVAESRCNVSQSNVFVLTGFVFRCDFGRKHKARRMNFMMGRVWVIGRADILGARTPVLSSGFYHAANCLPGFARSCGRSRIVQRAGCRPAPEAPRSLNRARADDCRPTTQSSVCSHSWGCFYFTFSINFF